MYSYFRAAEMMYNEAEAQYRLGNEQAVRALLEQTVKPYNADYTCTKVVTVFGRSLKHTVNLISATKATAGST